MSYIMALDAGTTSNRCIPVSYTHLIIDQSRQLGPRPLRHGIPQHNVYLFADDDGSGVQDMYERLVLTVQVAHDVLGAFGQLEQCLCADDLAGGRGLRGVVPGQKAQILQVVPDLFGLCKMCIRDSTYTAYERKSLLYKTFVTYPNDRKKSVFFLSTRCV